MISVENQKLLARHHQPSQSNYSLSSFMDAKSKSTIEKTMGLLKIDTSAENPKNNSSPDENGRYANKKFLYNARKNNTNGYNKRESRNGSNDENNRYFSANPTILTKPKQEIKKQDESSTTYKKSPATSANSNANNNVQIRIIQNPNSMMPAAAANQLATNDPATTTKLNPEPFNTLISNKNLILENSRSRSSSQQNQSWLQNMPSTENSMAKETWNNVSQVSNKKLESLVMKLNTLSDSMTSSIRLLDDSLNWHDTIQDHLIDQSDFLVVGILGKQGVGKSTLMTLLAESTSPNMIKNSKIFLKHQPSKSLARHSTNGIRAYVTSERTILLDVQPLMSGSILDKAIGTDKKNKYITNEYKFYDNYAELKSIELACFILSVCNVVIVTEDWFSDDSLFRLIRTSEMLKPSLGATLVSSSLQSDDAFQINNQPHLVYVLNKCEPMSKLSVDQMKHCLHDLTKRETKMIWSNSLASNSLSTRSMSQSNSNQTSFVASNSSKQSKLSNSCTTNDEFNMNFVIMPKFTSSTEATDEAVVVHNHILNAQNGYRGMPSFEKSANSFVNDILSIKSRSRKRNGTACGNLFGPNFTEKKWFTYAAKMWDMIRKSTSINEYNRLMT